MKLKKFLLVILGTIFTISLMACSSNYDASNIREFSDNITKNILTSMSDLNYEDFRKDFDESMDEMFPDKAAFIKLVMPIQESVGTYEEGSLEFIQAKKDKDSVSLLYKSKFTKEDKPVNISISFKEVDSKYKVCGLYFSSPKIRELSKENQNQ
ncbi:hypothetical protein UT300003_29170 [Clostridium sardiniense]